MPALCSLLTGTSLPCTRTAREGSESVTLSPLYTCGNDTSLRLGLLPEAHTVSADWSQECTPVCLDPNSVPRGPSWQSQDPKPSVSSIAPHHQNSSDGKSPLRSWPRATFHWCLGGAGQRNYLGPGRGGLGGLWGAWYNARISADALMSIRNLCPK